MRIHLVSIPLLLIGLLFIQSYAEVPLGCNIGGVDDWSTSQTMNNIVKGARYPFGSPQTPWDGKNGTVNEYGYPTEDFGIILYTGQIAGTLAATFNVWYIGNACKVNLVATGGTVGPVSFSKGVTSLQVTLTASETQFMLAFTGVTSAVANLTITRVGNPDPLSQPFNPALLKALAPFSGTLRFMDWGDTNGNPTSNWNQRALVEEATWNRVGVPYEIMIALGNTLNRDIWINVPHMATDDFVTSLAQLVQQNLKSNLNVYVEYSNEVWNWQFPQATWNLDEAEAEVKADPHSPLAYDGTTNIYYWGWRRIALRIKEISDIFASVWGAGAINNRVRPVLATQFAYPFVLQTGLEMLNASFGSVSKYIYATAGAPYFNLGVYNSNTNLTVEQGLAALQRSVDGMDSLFQQHLALSRGYGVKFLGYEGGSDTSGPNDLPVKEQINLDPGMAPIIKSYLDKWFGYGFSNFNWYFCDASVFDAPYGAWGLVQTIYDLTPVKYQTVEAYVSSQLQLNGGNIIPGAVDARLYTTRPANWQEASPYWTNQPAQPFYYVINTKTSGHYNMQASFAGSTAQNGHGIKVFLENKYIDTIIVPEAAVAPSKNFVFSEPISLALEEGINVINFTPTIGHAFSIQYLEFTLA